MRGRGIARVVRSNHPKFKSNDIVVATTGWQDYAIIRPDQEGVFGTYRISNPVKPLSLHLGILGAAGMTAYFGLTDVAATKPTDTVLVTAAAGGVGSCAVQIARCLGKDVIGVAGGLKKCQWLSESLNVAHVIDYKNQDLGQVIDAQCPNGVDVFFDNVGGQQLDCVLERLALGARVVICGFISTDYEHTHWGPKNYKYLLRRRAKMEGFFIFDYFDRFGEAEKQLASWYAAGDIQGTDDVVVGLEHMPDLLRSLFTGGNRGVCICQVAENGEL